MRFVDRLGVTYPALLDTDGAVAERYGVRGIPQTFFIDADGVVRDRVYGITSRGRASTNRSTRSLPQ